MNKTKRIMSMLLVLSIVLTVMLPETAYAKTKYVYKLTNETIYGSIDGDEWNKYMVYTYAYNSDGVLTRDRLVTYKPYDINKKDMDLLTRYIYNKDGTLKAEKRYTDGKYQSKTLYTYNKEKQLIKETHEMEDDIYNESYVMKYQYNKKGQLICKKKYKDGKLDFVTKYKYEGGNLVRGKGYEGEDMIPTWLYKYTDYDKNGNNLRYASYNYDDSGKAVLDHIVKYTYNSQNQQTAYKWYNSDRKLENSGTNKYNGVGDLIESGGDTYEYTYDKNGNKNEMIHYDIQPAEYSYFKHVYTYKKIAVKE